MRLPVQLLVELVDELEPFADNDTSERALDRFMSHAARAHAAAAGTRAGSAADDPLVAAAIDAFGEFLASLPQPTVLVLDTCEELAKLHPAGADVPAVERTFAILERLHRDRLRRASCSRGAAISPAGGGIGRCGLTPRRRWRAWANATI